MLTRPAGSPQQLREVAAALAAGAGNLRDRAAELENAGLGVPGEWGWSGRAASAYTRRWQDWKSVAHAVADRMDSPRPGARQVLEHLASELQAVQRQWDDAVSAAQGMGRSIDSGGYVSPRSTPPPSPPAPASPEVQIESDLQAAATRARQAYDYSRDSLAHLFDNGWVDAVDKMNNALTWATTPLNVVSSAAAINAGARYLQSIRNYPALAARLFGDEVAPAAEAYLRGDASLWDVVDAAWVGANRADLARSFTVNADRASFIRSGFASDSILDKLGGRVLLPLGIAQDVATILRPPSSEGTTEQRINQVASGVNLAGSLAIGADMLAGGGGLLAADAALGWVPVAGQVLLVGSALVLAGIWAYDNVPAFHDFCNSVGTETVHIASDAWKVASSGVTSIGHDIGGAVSTAGKVEHTVTNALGGAAHAVSGFFHWP